MKNYLIFILLLFLNVKLFSQNAGIIYNENKTCKFFTNFNSTDRYFTWNGQCQGGFVDGTGVLNMYEGGKLLYIFKGNINNGFVEGYGIMEWIGNGTYEGNFKNGKMEGYAIRIFGNGEKYEGNYTNNKINGNGTYHYNNGNVYEGEFVDGKKQGNGKYIWNNNNSDEPIYFIGEFYNNVRNGYGTIYYKNGTNWSGTWKNDKPQ